MRAETAAFERCPGGILPRQYAWMMVGLLALGLLFAFEVLEFIDRKLSEQQRKPPDDARR